MTLHNTHSACDEQLQKFGGETPCCECTGHSCIKPKTPPKRKGFQELAADSSNLDDSMVARIRKRLLELGLAIEGPEMEMLLDIVARAREEGRREGRVAEVEHLMQWNGSYIHDCGRRINGLLHRSVLEERLNELQEEKSNVQD